MDALDFDDDMWHPEYCDSELRALASGESRDELCPCQQTQLKLNRRLTGGIRVTSAWQWPSDAMDKKCCWDYPYAWLHPDLRCLAEFLSLAVLSIQLGTSFQLYCLLRNPAANNVYNLGQLPIASYSTKHLGVPHLLKRLVGFWSMVILFIHFTLLCPHNRHLC